MGGIPDSPFDIDGDDAYVSSVNDVLEMINSYPVGRAVIGEARRLGKINIAPYSGGFNAETGGEQSVWARKREVNVSFTPATFASGPTADPRIKWPGMRVDEVLIHELVHAVNGLGPGRNMHKPTGAMAPYGYYDDFYAIMVANIYQSEKGEAPSLLRNSHALTATGMQNWEAISEIYLFKDGHYPWVKKFCEQNNHFAHIVARSHAKFNPLQIYFALNAEPDDYDWPAPDLSDVPTTESADPPDRRVAYETRAPMTDSIWLEILNKRFRADDVAGYGARARRLVALCASANAPESLVMFTRLLLQPPGDLVAKLFHDNLSTPLRKKVLNQLRKNLGKK